MSDSWDENRLAFVEAARWFADVTALVTDRWDRPGLGEWDVRSLVGHTSRAVLTVEAYLDRPATEVEVPSAAAYVEATSAVAGGPDVTVRGHDAGVALGDDPAAAVVAIVHRVTPLLADLDGSELVTTIVGGMRLADYLPTRTFELVAHTTDLATALGVTPSPPAASAAQALLLVSEIAVARDLAGPVLLAVTGRQALPPGFTVL